MSTTSRHSMLLLLILVLCGAQGARAQGARQDSATAAVSELRIGLQAGVQTNVLRYMVVPYRGEFQAVVEESVVPGVVMQFPITADWSMQAEISIWSQEWSAHHDGDPKIGLRRDARTIAEFPLMLAYRAPFTFVPLYVAAGPVITLVTDAEAVYRVQYTSFSERDGWSVNTQEFDEEALRAAFAADLGLELELAPGTMLQSSLRFMQPMGMVVEEERLELRDLSYWRFRLALLLTL